MPALAYRLTNFIILSVFQILNPYFCIHKNFMPYKAVIAGASGLVGSTLLNQLLNHFDYHEVLVLTRKKLSVQHKKLTQLVVDFNRLDEYADDINGHAIFCCLGTTRSKTPDLKIYRKIDHDYPVHLAKIGAKNSMQQFHFISSLGANPQSFSFYTKLKGETEDALKNISIRCLYIYQPSLLTGSRQEKRIGERFATVLMNVIDPILFGKLEKYKSISAEVVAGAMVNQSLKNNSGIFTYPSDQIKKLA